MARRKAAAAPAAGGAPSFEEAIARLEEIVRELEEADLPLDRSLAVFEEGVRLSRLLHGKLDEAERKVEVLLKDGEGGLATAPFPAAGAAGDAGGDADDDDAEDDDDENDDDDDDDDDDDGDAPAPKRRGGGRGSGQTTLGF